MSIVPLGDVPEYRDSVAATECAQRYRLLLENSSDAVWTMTLDGTFTYVSPSVQRVLGYPPEELTSVFRLQYPPTSTAAPITSSSSPNRPRSSHFSSPQRYTFPLGHVPTHSRP